jgi:hypothetical protein
MLKSRTLWLLSILLACLMAGCRPDSLSPDKYTQWIGNPSNGLVQQRQVAVFDFSLQYWPSEFRAWRELGNGEVFSQIAFDSIATANRKSLYFLFTISPTEGKAKGDVLYSGISDYHSYDQRMRMLAFRMKEYWLLRSPDGEEFHPVLASMEQTFSISESRKVHLVFAPPDTVTHFQDMPLWDIEYRDEIFGTGIHHFVFEKENWEKVPDLSLPRRR